MAPCRCATRDPEATFSSRWPWRACCTSRRHADPGGVLRLNAQRLGALSCLLFVVSWFLPAAYTKGELVGGRTWGWQAFLFAFSPVLGNDVDGSLLLKTWMVTSAASNTQLCATLVLLAWRAQAVSRPLVWSLGGATLVNAYWFVLPDMRPALRVGYYVWLMAFALGTAAAGASTRARSTSPDTGTAAA